MYSGDDPVNESDPLGLCWPSWACGVENAVGDYAQSTARVAGDVQIGSDIAALACTALAAVCGEAVPVAALASQVSGAVATTASCTAGILGKNVDPCVESLIIQTSSAGFLSGPALSQALDLWAQFVQWLDGQQAGASEVDGGSQINCSPTLPLFQGLKWQ